jgi:hypothetical protein
MEPEYRGRRSDRTEDVNRRDIPSRDVAADHPAGERPILVYRVADLGATLAELSASRNPGRFTTPN